MWARRATVPRVADQDTEEQTASVHSLALQLLGQFARVQDAIDNGLAAGYFKIRTPGAAKMVIEKTIRRLSDEDRRELFLSIAKELNTDAELDEFTSTFRRVKKLRDLLAHSGELTGTSDDAVGVAHTYVRNPDMKERTVEAIDRAALREAISAASWMSAQVMYVAQASGVIKELRAGDSLVRFLKPSRLPKDWNRFALEVLDE